MNRSTPGQVVLSPFARFTRGMNFASWSLAALLALAAPRIHAQDTAVISGTVSNAATGNLLEGARVTVTELGRTAFADETGRFVLTGLPPGTYELVASYIGLDAMKAQVNVMSGGRAERN